MYNLRFVSDSGLVYNFGVNGDNVFDSNIGDGISVNIGTSQGFSQVGQTVESRSVEGKPITIEGVIFRNIESRKKEMRRVFSPFSSGRMFFNDSYYTRVYVKNAPTFSPVKGNGKFSMQLFAPYPFFYSPTENNIEIGKIQPKFKFPVNYAVPHLFGERTIEKYSNVFNDGDVAVPFSLHMSTIFESTNPTVTNLETLEFVKINGKISSGDVIHIYRDDDMVLRAELTNSDGTKDIISWLDEESSLFELKIGDNLLMANDDQGGLNLITRFSYKTAVGALYES